jgi:hypothetical protein
MNAEQLALCVREEEYHPLLKGYLLFLALNNPEELCKVGKELCRQKRRRRNPLWKCPRGHDLQAAYYEACSDSTSAPTFSKVKAAFIAKHGKTKWGNNDDDPKAGDFSARMTLNILGLPLQKAKRGRPRGSKSSRLSGPQALFAKK